MDLCVFVNFAIGIYFITLLIHVIFQVLGIQKLAAEMGLKCITTYKLDALRSVLRINNPDSQDAPQHGESESIQNPDSSKSGIEKILGAALGCTHGEFNS